MPMLGRHEVLMRGSNLEVKIHPANCQKYCEKMYTISNVQKATKSVFAPFIFGFQLISTLPYAESLKVPDFSPSRILGPKPQKTHKFNIFKFCKKYVRYLPFDTSYQLIYMMH